MRIPQKCSTEQPKSDLKILDQDHSQTYITKLLASKCFEFRLSSGGFRGVGPVTHLKPPGHGLIVHYLLSAEFLTLSVAENTEIFPVLEDILRPVTHWALGPRPRHLEQ